jgi:hypothetical protein
MRVFAIRPHSGKCGCGQQNYRRSPYSEAETVKSIQKTVEKITLETSVCVDSETGKVLSACFRIRFGNSAETQEFGGGNALADCGAKGRLLGVEIIGPCEGAILGQISKGQPDPVKSFLQNAMPAQMLLAS